MSLVDTHCHLQDAAFDQDREDVLDRALSDLEWIAIIGDDLKSSRAAVALVRDRVYAAVGVHPYYPETVTDATLTELRSLCETPRVVAVGEIGLDYHHGGEDRDAQRSAFEKQLALAADAGLPVVIHNRDSHEDISAILDEHHARLAGGIMHCFAGDPAFAEKCMEWNFHVSFAGNVTFPKATELRDAAQAIPLDRLLVETDAPYLSPQPVRGKRCEPAYVRHTAQVLADLYDVPLEEFARRTTDNANALFNIAVAPHKG